MYLAGVKVGSEGVTGNTGNTGNAPAPESCPRCGADHMTLVQRQGNTACVGCSTLSDTELARLLASRATPLPASSNGTHSQPGCLPPTSTTPAQAAEPDDYPDDDERTIAPPAIPIAFPPCEAPLPLRPDPGGTQACPQCDRPLRLTVGEKGVYCTVVPGFSHSWSRGKQRRELAPLAEVVHPCWRPNQYEEDN